MLLSLIEKLLLKENLTTAEAKEAAMEMLAMKNPLQIAAFLTLARAKGETLDELCGFVQAMREKMIPVNASGPLLDIVGTGGDGRNSINISTGSSLLAASLGVKIAKHGNRSVTSLCGSADLLEALGLKINLSAEEVVRCIETLGIGFMYAPNFHPALKNLKELRRGLKLRTCFNFLGPVLNPASARYQMIGVAEESLLDLAASLLHRLQDIESAWVFYGQGLDEISTLGPIELRAVTPDGVQRFSLDPRELGLSYCSFEELRGGSPKENAERLLEVFAGKEDGLADTLALNAAVALLITKNCTDLKEGLQRAKKALKEKRPLELIEKWRRLCTLS
jgi:anthranilate phosphoribosyltransferase